MSYRLLLDENVEVELVHRLRDAGHDVVHVDQVHQLGKGTTDREIGTYSIESDRIVLTYDADFALEVDEERVRGVLYFTDESMSVADVADVVDEISRYYPQRELTGLLYAGPEWL